MGQKLDELKHFTEQVKRDAAGKWDEILWTLVPEIQDAFIGATGRTKHITCPFHGGVRDFRPALGGSFGNAYRERGTCVCSCGTFDGWQVVMQYRRWKFNEAVEEVSKHLRGVGYQPTKPFVPEKREEKAENELTDAQLMARMQRWWSESKELDHPDAGAARKYFKGRKIGELLLPLADVRLHPSLGFWEEVTDEDGNEHFSKAGEWPCLLSVIRTPDGRVSTLHRAWITEDGKKIGKDNARKQYTSLQSNPVTGGAIRLDDLDGNPVLHVAEGLETALAARAITRQPTWSTVNAGMLKQLVVPEGVRIVVIWADLDRSGTGERVSNALAERLAEQGIASMVFLPPVALPEGVKTIDWNDIVASIGLEAARNHFQVLRVMRWVNEQLNRINVRPENVAIA